MDLLIFIVLMKIQFAIHLKHSKFWPLAGVKPVSSDVVLAIGCG